MDLEVLGGRVTIDATLVSGRPSAIREEIREYAEGTRRTFSLDVSVPGGFTGEVMAAMAEIPYGTTRTYGDIAADLDTAPVAVGQAAGRNPVPIIVPCHRVVEADGLGGYSAAGGPSLKERLLRHEGVVLP